VKGRWFVVGLGRAGLTLAVALDRAGVLHGASTRSAHRARGATPTLRCGVQQTSLPDLGELRAGDAVLIAVPDAVMPRLAKALSIPRGVSLVHCSGVHGADVLPRLLGERRGACHPLMSLGGPADCKRLVGAFFAVDGTGPGVDAARALASHCGGVPTAVGPDARGAYHAAAVLAGNGVFGLLHAARTLCDASGIGGGALYQGLSDLAAASAVRTGSEPIASVATGPVARDDASTLTQHLQTLATLRPELVTLYLETQRSLLSALEAADAGNVPRAAHHALREPDTGPQHE
jgi:predicted short-subunit dehydrogenase-like oxidoreductase (DUF2520 family)